MLTIYVGRRSIVRERMAAWTRIAFRPEEVPRFIAGRDVEFGDAAHRLVENGESAPGGAANPCATDDVDGGTHVIFASIDLQPVAGRLV